MFLHLGNNITIPCKDIVALLDLSTASNSEKTREFLELARVEKRLEDSTDQQKAKTCVLTTDHVYFSSISTATLSKRVNFFKQKSLR